jgi:transcription-repair coupling factor (superfamily II helicase)
MDYLITPLKELEEYKELIKGILNYKAPLAVSGISDSQKAHICHALSSYSNAPGVFVAFNEMQARKFFEDFSFFLGDAAVFYPNKEIILYDVEAKSHDDVHQRLGALDRILNNDFKIIVTSVEAISHKMLDPQIFSTFTIEIESGQELNLDEIISKLVKIGYKRVHTVDTVGQFAVRGGIIDIFSLASEYAVRIELFGDQIDSIRQFDVDTQRSVGMLEKIRLIPAQEIADEKNTFCMIDYVRHVRDDALVFVDEPTRQQQRIENLLLEHYETCRGLIEKELLSEQEQEVYFDYTELQGKLEMGKTVYLSTINSAASEGFYKRSITIPGKSIASFQGHMDLLCDSIRSWKDRKSRVIILSGTKGRGERLRETLFEMGIDSFYSEKPDAPIQAGQVMVTRGSLSKGFEYPTINFVIVSDKEIFGQERRTVKKGSKKKGQKIDIFTELNPGDYVVHETHGIGRYVGIEQLEVEGVKRDYLKIAYRDNGYLYIPTNQMDLIQKYIGSGDKTPRLSKLGGTEWFKTKARVKKNLKELAAELIELYAKRQAKKGFKFSPDTVWQRQFEEQFPYQETDDQLKCVEEIKQDMESGKLMDRLLCGDVGYGKTEVASRAAFKTVMDGKQVAYLVPTTVLAQQMYTTFKERVKDFPITVDVVSRFRTPAEQKKLLKNAKSGNVDILIGTHRLLQKDVQFKDLGLLIVDEEQRFGVSHKERIKSMTPDVNVLTLTATPIPRTLHMSLVGIKDISIIEDPPEERYPVQTYVMEYNDEVVKDAICREMARDGQVFYLYNWVRTIEQKAAELQKAVPEARIAVAHGQMGERELEDIIFKFIEGQYDILVCTTIIESGIDMPNVNTIIIEDADKMGLAQLYQLRGRVGRSNKLAYAYITYKKDKVINEIAEKRLQTIKEFTDLGSGFKIAMRDLEIRGAGNLLGLEQHGHMESVGYDMYCKLLDEAVAELSGKETKKESQDISIDINISAYIDDSYISDESRKIEMYKRIASIQDEQDVLDVEDELIDRYGDMPLEVRNLIKIAYIKALAGQLGISAITEKNGQIMFKILDLKSISLAAIGKLADEYKRQILFNAGTNPYIIYKISDMDKSNLLDNIKIMLQNLKNYELNS